MKKFLFVLLACATSASAQAWPGKPLRYIVPFPPGAFNDTLARTLAAELPKTLGQPVVVENRPGGNTPNLLVANTGAPFNNVQELTAYARANPGKLNYGSAGNGTSNHLSYEL